MFDDYLSDYYDDGDFSDEEIIEPSLSNDYYVDMAKYAEYEEKDVENYCWG